ncbi:MAG: ArsR/SmtB family transcription factor [Chloroflexota bacterium]
MKEDYQENEIKMARYAKALSHPARLQILRLLASSATCYCGNLVDELPLSQSTVSQHLKELKDAGLIQGVIQPPKVKYCINPAAWEEASKLFGEFLQIKNAVFCEVEEIVKE